MLPTCRVPAARAVAPLESPPVSFVRCSLSLSRFFFELLLLFVTRVSVRPRKHGTTRRNRNFLYSVSLALFLSVAGLMPLISASLMHTVDAE